MRSAEHFEEVKRLLQITMIFLILAIVTVKILGAAELQLPEQGAETWNQVAAQLLKDNKFEEAIQFSRNIQFQKHNQAYHSSLPLSLAKKRILRRYLPLFYFPS